MKYKLRSFDVDAIRLPDTTMADGERFIGGCWLVVMNDKLASFSNEEFAEKFEAVDGQAALSIAEQWEGKMKSPKPARPGAVPRKVAAVEKPTARVDAEEKQSAEKSLSQQILDALKATPRTRAALGTVLEGVNTTKLSQSLWYLKKHGQVIYDEDRELYRLPTAKVNRASA